MMSYTHLEYFPVKYLLYYKQTFKGNYGGNIPVQPLFSQRRKQAIANKWQPIGTAGPGQGGDPYHDFNYYNGKDGQQSVRIVMDNNRLVITIHKQFNKINVKVTEVIK